jgi:hypothetical protein
VGRERGHGEKGHDESEFVSGESAGKAGKGS